MTNTWNHSVTRRNGESSIGFRCHPPDVGSRMLEMGCYHCSHDVASPKGMPGTSLFRFRPGKAMFVHEAHLPTLPPHSLDMQGGDGLYLQMLWGACPDTSRIDPVHF